MSGDDQPDPGIDPPAPPAGGMVPPAYGREALHGQAAPRSNSQPRYAAVAGVLVAVLVLSVVLAGAGPEQTQVRHFLPIVGPNGLLLGAATAAAIVASCPDSRPDGTAMVPWTPHPVPNSLPAVGVEIPEMSHDHVPVGTTVAYNHVPPTSGCHYSTTTGYGAPVPHGVHTRTIPPEYWVHNLEHGYIVVLYNCPLGCDADIAALGTWYGGLPNDSHGFAYAKALVLPYPAMTPHIAMVSYNWYDHTDGALDIGEVQRFYLNHVGQGPEQAG